MLQPFGLIADVFDFAGHGCTVLVLDGDIAPDVKLHIGDEVAVVSEGCDPVRTIIKGIQLGHRPGSGFVGIVLGPEVKRTDLRASSLLMKEIG